MLNNVVGSFGALLFFGFWISELITSTRKAVAPLLAQDILVEDEAVFVFFSGDQRLIS